MQFRPMLFKAYCISVTSVVWSQTNELKAIKIFSQLRGISPHILHTVQLQLSRDSPHLFYPQTAGIQMESSTFK